ncbi:MAG: glycosyltransferase [Candidatus Krumholzibacteriota bacterium]|nr:glycosyltransferase [Candidatus Krumholzibacteriota bacterium]
MKVLCVTNLFPDASRPGLAPFNRQQFLHLAASHELAVVSPVPWPHRLRFALAGRAPRPTAETAASMSVVYPTYWYAPKAMRRFYGRWYERAIAGPFRQIAASLRPDIVYATWAYPDCWAAARLAAGAGLPLVSRLHGTDVNQGLESRARRPFVLEAMRASSRIVAVSAALRQTLVEAGIDGSRIAVVMNGIDTALFRPRDRSGERRRLGLRFDARIVLYAGNFKAIKGVPVLVEAFARAAVPGAELHLVGDGPQERLLRGLARRAGIAGSVFFHGRAPHERVASFMGAADLFCLPSLAEGTPNVVLEALACGLPVVATDTGGTPEILAPENGILVPPGAAEALAGAIVDGLGRGWDRARIVSPAGSWEENARRISVLFAEAAAGEGRVE